MSAPPATWSSTERLGEKDDGEHGRDERLQVRRERRPGRRRCGGGRGTRGCSSARAGRAWRGRAAPRSPTRASQSCREVAGGRPARSGPRPRDHDRAHARRRVRRMSGVTATEYAAHVAAVARPRRMRRGSRRRRRRPRRPRRARRRRPRSPPRARSAASGARGRVRAPKSAVKIGIAPSSSPIVDAVVTSSANTKRELVEPERAAASARTGRWRRSIRSERSTERVRPTKIAAASA